MHPAIREDVWALYHRGKFDTDVFEAMKAVEVAVRYAAKRPAKDVGTTLTRKAFDSHNGPFADMNADQAERDARAHLFSGAIGSYKKPHSHRNVVLDDPEEASCSQINCSVLSMRARREHAAASGRTNRFAIVIGGSLSDASASRKLTSLT
ncbi:TIGR02391 family protein [Bradyrhizobium sp. CCGUVB23]|uniref:TIGR02391 family protein n=1 Tax=Bradyrhizobium sp. CCGUVB23 TaxID=2949630 RepID=UPI0020B2B236|nr:TIGR02391 family protein [Bradyrhizobium sp. CCGUVB23]MCP3460414.1 TIGR02391 family protein [Bradyrhizobium sp. CCGUVB23]